MYILCNVRAYTLCILARVRVAYMIIYTVCILQSKLLSPQYDFYSVSGPLRPLPLCATSSPGWGERSADEYETQPPQPSAHHEGVPLRTPPGDTAGAGGASVDFRRPCGGIGAGSFTGPAHSLGRRRRCGWRRIMSLRSHSMARGGRPTRHPERYPAALH